MRIQRAEAPAASPAGWDGGLLFEPCQHVGGVPIRRKDRIEHLLDVRIEEDQCGAFEQGHARHLKGREAQGTGEGEGCIAQDLEGQV